MQGNFQSATRRAGIAYLVRRRAVMLIHLNYLAIYLFGIGMNIDLLFAFFSLSHWRPPFLGSCPKSLERQSLKFGGDLVRLARRAQPILCPLFRVVNSLGSGRIGACLNLSMAFGWLLTVYLGLFCNYLKTILWAKLMSGLKLQHGIK